MALDLASTYPGQIDTSDPQYPQGKARNVVTEGDGTGTPWEKRIVNDQLGFQQALLNQAGITPSGSPDEVGTSDYLDAINVILSNGFAKRGIRNWERSFGDLADGGYSRVIIFSMNLRGADFDPITKTWIGVGNSEGCIRSIDDGLFFGGFVAGMGASIDLTDIAIGASSSAVAVGDGATVYQRASILSGSWGTVVVPGAPDELFSIVFDPTNSRFIVVGNKAGGGYVATSNDPTGTAFTDRSGALPASFSTIEIGSVAVNGAGIVIGGPAELHDKIAVSTNGGIAWSDSTTPLVSGEYQVTYSVALDLFVAVRVDNETNNQVYTSPDGDVWTLKFSGSLGFDSDVGGPHQHGVAAYGIMLVVCGNDTENFPILSVSSDAGATWTTQRIGWNNLESIHSVLSDRVNGRLLATFSNTGVRSLRILPG